MIGVFAPAISFPVTGSMNYFNSLNFFLRTSSDGFIIVVLAMLSFILTLTKRIKFLVLTGGLSLTIVIVTFFNVRSLIGSIRADIIPAMENNLFGGGMLDMIQFEWGWPVLLIGAITLMTAAFMKNDGSRSSEGLTIKHAGIFTGAVAGWVALRYTLYSGSVVPILFVMLFFALSGVIWMGSRFFRRPVA